MSNFAKLENEMLDLMKSVEADKVTGGIEDDPRIERIGNILTLMQIVSWEDYKRVAKQYFTPACD